MDFQRRLEWIEAFKAVSEHEDGQLYALGMKGAKPIHLPLGCWVNGGEYGISAGRTAGGARQVIRFARDRKVLPIPPGMQVVKVQSRGLIFQNQWRYIFHEIRILYILPREAGDE